MKYNVRMKFEWDQAKANANSRKHGVTFDEARSVFFVEELHRKFVEKN